VILKQLRIRRRLDGLVMRGSQSTVALILLFVNSILMVIRTRSCEIGVRTMVCILRKRPEIQSAGNAPTAPEFRRTDT
jgi:hypothetical protein